MKDRTKALREAVGEEPFETAWKAMYAAQQEYKKSFVGSATPDAITAMIEALVSLGWTPPAPEAEAELVERGVRAAAGRWRAYLSPPPGEAEIADIVRVALGKAR